MKTWLAALIHAGIGVLQAAVTAPVVTDPKHADAAQITLSLVLAGLQAAVAYKNSNTDPAGNDLVKTSTGYASK